MDAIFGFNLAYYKNFGTGHLNLFSFGILNGATSNEVFSENLGQKIQIISFNSNHSSNILLTELVT